MFGQQNNRREAKPWLKNKKWASGRIPATGDAASFIGLGIVSSGCAVIAIVIFFYQNEVQPRSRNWLPVGVLSFFTVCFCAGAFYTRALREKFGRTFFKLDSIPGIVGGVLSGVIQFENPHQEPTTYLIKLQCLKMMPSTADSSKFESEVVWENRQAVSISKESVGQSRDIPVRFHIPGNALETGDPCSRRNIIWQLEAHAKLHGLDFNAAFEVPIYRIETEANPAAP